MSETSTHDKVTEIESLRARLAELEADTVEEVSDALDTAEENVAEVAETSHDEVSESAETIETATDEVVEAVETEATGIADELGHPELAGQIADELFRRMDERGLLPQLYHETHTAPVAESAPPPAPAAPAPEAVADAPPEPAHWFWRKRGR